MFRHFEMNMEEHNNCGPRGHRWGARQEGRESHFGPPRGMGRGFGPRGGFGPGGGRERMFDGGEVRLVILQQLADEPSYGYQLIKRMEERMSGGYTPSAGVVYPTLTLLEEQGLTAATVNDTGKKVYAVTEEGRAFLQANKDRLKEVGERLKEAGRGFRRGRSPLVMEAFLRLREAVGQKASGENITLEQVKKIAEAINSAAKAIHEL